MVELSIVEEDPVDFLENMIQNIHDMNFHDVFEYISNRGLFVQEKAMDLIHKYHKISKKVIRKEYLDFLEQQIKEEMAPEYTSAIDSQASVYLNHSGIVLVRSTQSDVQTIQIFIWDSFKILCKYLEKISDLGETELFFDFVLNGEIYMKKSFTQIKKILIEKCCQNARYGSYCTNLLKQMADDAPIIEIGDHCGFLEDGWALPIPEEKEREFLPLRSVEFRYIESFMNQTIRLIREMLALDYNEEKAIKLMHDIYNATAISHKDIIFAFGVAAPFLHVYKKLTSIMPQLHLGGEKANGKSEITRVIIEKIWNQKIFTTDNWNRASHFMASLSGSTFPVGIDDAEDLDPKYTSILKSHGTKEVSFVRKTPSQTFVVNTILKASFILNYNITPEMILDDAARDRLLYIEPILDKNKIRLDWGIFMSEIPDGLLGKHIILKTKEWTIENVKEILKTLPTNPSLDTRGNHIYRFFLFGKKIMKDCFGIDLDVSEVPDLIGASRRVGAEEIMEAIRFKALHGLQVDDFGVFRPTTWVRTPTKIKNYNGINGILLDNEDKNEILMRFEDKRVVKRTRLSDFYRKLAPWPDCILGNFSYEGSTHRYIFIPSKYLVGANIPLTSDLVNSLPPKDDLDSNDIEIDKILGGDL